MDLRSFLFEPQNTLNDLQQVISDQLSTYAQGITILDVSVDFSDVDINSISVAIKYINPNNTVEQYLLNADLGTASTATYV